ncbi:MAG: hypothetical protein ACO3JG_15615 [Luteolibacter sp.]
MAGQTIYLGNAWCMHLFSESMPSLGLIIEAATSDQRGCIREGRQTASTGTVRTVHPAKDNAAASVGSRKKNRGLGGMDSENAGHLPRREQPTESESE